MNIVPCEPQHIRSIDLQPRQQFVTGLARMPNKAEEIVKAGPCFTGLVDDRVIACLGIIQEGERTRDLCWTMLSKDAGPYLVTITRAAIRFMDSWPAPLFAYGEAEWVESMRWHRLLGFTVVGKLIDAQRWLPDGRGNSATYHIWMRAGQSQIPSHSR